jgi:hypothetical protein
VGIDQSILPASKDEAGIITTRLDDLVRWGRKNLAGRCRLHCVLRH